MRPIVLLGLALTLSGCGFKTWWHPPFTGGTNPNMPVSDSPNMQRILGNRSTVDPIISEPGDIWPGQIVSYKGEVKQNGLSEDTRIVFFHGEHKPHQLPHLGWIRKHWVDEAERVR